MKVSEHITSRRLFYELRETFPDLLPTDEVVFIAGRVYRYLPVLRMTSMTTEEDRVVIGVSGRLEPLTVDLEQFAFGESPFRRLWLAHVGERHEFVVCDPIRAEERRFAAARREREAAKPREGEEIPYNSRLVDRLMKLMEDMR